MKKHIIYLLVSGFALLSNMALTSCSDDDVEDANDVLVVKSVLPTKVMEGQVVTITGTGLEKATSVVFPGNVSVNNITKVGNGYISVITPAGVSAEGGTVTIEANGESAESKPSFCPSRRNRKQNKAKRCKARIIRIRAFFHPKYFFIAAPLLWRTTPRIPPAEGNSRRYPAPARQTGSCPGAAFPHNESRIFQ